jgi:hypothetical protein
MSHSSKPPIWAIVVAISCLLRPPFELEPYSYPQHVAPGWP